MKTKKWLSIILAASMVFSLLAGCASNSLEASVQEDTSNVSAAVETEPSTATAENATVADPTENLDTESESTPSYTIPISEEPLTYTLWMNYAPFAANLGFINTDTMEGCLVLDTLQEVTNVHFDITACNGAAESDNFNLMIAAGDYCDIITAMSLYSTGLEGAVDDGIVQDLADVLPEKCPIYWSYLSSNTNSLMEAYTDSGYMPNIAILLPEVGQEVNGLVLRQDWLNDFGMEMPTTYDTLYTYLEKALSEKGAQFEVASSDGILADLAFGNNIDIGGYEVIDGVVEYGKVQEAFKDYLKFMNRLYENGIISQNFFADTAQDMSSSARLNFGLGTNSLLSVGATNTSDVMMNVSEDSFEMAVLPYISTDGTVENHVGPDSLTSVMKMSACWCFSTECYEIEPLLQMVEFCYSDEGYLLTNYGVEDVTYTLDENGAPQWTELVTDNPDGLSFFFATYAYATNAASGFFPYINDMSRTFYDFNSNQWQVFEDLKNLSDCAYNYPLYATMTTEENTTFSSIESDLDTFMDTVILEFITGAKDVDADFDTFVETLYSMNLQKMIDIKQAAYDRAMERVASLSA